MLPTPAQGWKATVRQFSDGNATAAFSFSAPGTNSSVSIRLPKAADITKATVDISSTPYLQNLSIIADTRDDFAGCTLDNLDINTTPGEVFLLKEHSLSDDFNGTTLDPGWSWLNPPSAYDVGLTRAGYLHMVSNNMTNFNGSNDDGAFLYQNVSGNFTLETKINCTPRWDWQKAGMMVRQDADNWVALKYQNQTGKHVEWSVKTGGSMWTDILTGALSASTVYLRLVKDGSRWLSYYSTDGLNWLLVWDTSDPSGQPVPLADPLKAGLIIADGGSDTFWPADFDYFNFSRYVPNGTLVAPPLQTAGAVTQARAFWHGPVEPSDSSFFFNVRTGPAAQWQRLMNATTTPIYEPGTSVQYMFEMTSAGVRTGDLFDLSVNFSTMLYAYGLSLGFGGDAPFWDHAGALCQTETVDLRSALADYLFSAAPDADGNVTVPLDLACGSPGTPVLANLTVEFNMGAPPLAPKLLSPAADGFVTTGYPALNLSCTDPDNDDLLFSIEFSQDGFASNTTYDQQARPLGWDRKNSSYGPGEVATFSMPFPLSQGHTYSWRARAFDGSYWGPFSPTRDFTVDTTPPAGTVLVGDRFTGDQYDLSALLQFRDDESGIAGYEYMIGTGPGSWDIFPSTLTSNATVTVGGLTLRTGTSYYFTARALDRAGLWSGWVSSTSVQYWDPGQEPLGIRIGTPAAGDVRGIVTISGTAWLRDGWTKNDTVQIRIDNDPWKYEPPVGLNQTRTWTVSWDTRLLDDGPHLIWARLVDGRANASQLAVDQVAVNVSNGHAPAPLSAAFWPDPSTPVGMAEGARAEFWANASLAGAIFAWYLDGQLVDGETFAKFVLHANYTSAGAHDVTAALSFGDQTVGRTWNVTVANVDRPPVAAILTPPSGTAARTDEPVVFNASDSTDPDLEDHLHYAWDMGDGTALEGMEVTHEYRKAGTYTVTLTVSDGKLQDALSINLTVQSPTHTIKAAGIDATPFVALALALVVLAAAGGGYIYARRRRAARAKEAAEPGTKLMYGLQAPSLVDEEDDEGHRPRQTTRDEWRRLESEAASRPPPAPVSAAPPARAPPALQNEPESFEEFPMVEGVLDEAMIPDFEVEMIPEAPARPVWPAEGARPGMTATHPPQQRSPSPVQEPPTSYRPTGHQPPSTRSPAAPAQRPVQPFRPAAEPGAARQRPGPADSIDELMALLEKNR